jgi:lipooligosaccharide transport system permease protein
LSLADTLSTVRPGPWDIWLRNATVWKRNWKTSLVASVGEPLLYFLGLGIGLGTLIPSVGGLPYLHYVAPGLIFSSVMYSATIESTYNSFTKMEHQKVYASMVLSPLTFSDIVLGEVLWATTKGLISGGTILLLSLAARIGTPWPGLLAIPLILLAGLVFSSLGLIVTSFARSYDSFNYYFTLFIAPMFFFSGIFFPLKKLGSVVESASFLFPLTHFVKVSRALLTGGNGVGVVVSALFAVFIAAIALRTAARLMEKRFMP